MLVHGQLTHLDDSHKIVRPAVTSHVRAPPIPLVWRRNPARFPLADSSVVLRQPEADKNKNLLFSLSLLLDKSFLESAARMQAVANAAQKAMGPATDPPSVVEVGS